MRVFDACCRSDNVRSRKKRVQLGGLFMSPVRFLDGNWPFLYAGFDGLELLLSEQLPSACSYLAAKWQLDVAHTPSKTFARCT